jgi:WD40 repeat protein
LSELLWSTPSTHRIFEIEISSDGRLAGCLCSDGKIRLWDLASHEMLYTLPYQCPSFLSDPHRYWLSFLDPSTLILGGLKESAYIRFSGKRPVSTVDVSR